MHPAKTVAAGDSGVLILQHKVSWLVPSHELIILVTTTAMKDKGTSIESEVRIAQRVD
jgi:hypothetical protein